MVSALEDYQAMDIKVGQKFWYTPFPPSLPAIPPKNKFEIFLEKFVKYRFGSLQMWHASEVMRSTKSKLMISWLNFPSSQASPRYKSLFTQNLLQNLPQNSPQNFSVFTLGFKLYIFLCLLLLTYS